MGLKGTDLHNHFWDIGGALFWFARCLHFFPQQYNDNKQRLIIQCDALNKKTYKFDTGLKRSSNAFLSICTFFAIFFDGVIRDFSIFVIKKCSVRHRDVQIFIVCVFVIRNVNPEFGIAFNYC